jgi:uncharacterized protein YbjT (DUF2867 family)
VNRAARKRQIQPAITHLFMNIIIFGVTGMVGLGVLRECLLDPDVKLVRTVGRTATGMTHPKLVETVHEDLWHYSTVEAEMSGFDACFFCLGVSAAGMTETDYTHITYDLTIAAAEVLSRLNPGMVFTYVSGAGTDSTEQGRVMWARVKGKTENALSRFPFKTVYLFLGTPAQVGCGEWPRRPRQSGVCL